MIRKIPTLPALLMAGVMAVGGVATAHAAESVEWNVVKTLQLEATPVDVVISSDGKRIFVLTDKGDIVIYSNLEKPEATIEVGPEITQMKLGPGGNTLILTSRDKKSVEIVTLDFMQTIEFSGAPFKGPENAPIVIAVFSDFQ